MYPILDILPVAPNSIFESNIIFFQFDRPSARLAGADGLQGHGLLSSARGSFGGQGFLTCNFNLIWATGSTASLFFGFSK